MTDRQDRQSRMIGWLAAQNNRCVVWRLPSLCGWVGCDGCSRECLDLSSMHPSHTAGSQTDGPTALTVYLSPIWMHPHNVSCLALSLCAPLSACAYACDTLCGCRTVCPPPSLCGHLSSSPVTPEHQPMKGVGAFGLPGSDRDAHRAGGGGNGHTRLLTHPTKQDSGCVLLCIVMPVYQHERERERSICLSVPCVVMNTCESRYAHTPMKCEARMQPSVPRTDVRRLLCAFLSTMWPRRTAGESLDGGWEERKREREMGRRCLFGAACVCWCASCRDVSGHATQ